MNRYNRESKKTLCFINPGVFQHKIPLSVFLYAKDKVVISRDVISVYNIFRNIKVIDIITRTAFPNEWFHTILYFSQKYKHYVTEKFNNLYTLLIYGIQIMTQNMTQKSKPKFKRFVFYATPEFVEEIDKIANKLGVNRSEVVRMALRDLMLKWGDRSGKDNS